MAPHLDYDSDETRLARAVATAVLVLWGVCFPVFLGLLIKVKASDPTYSFVIVSYGYKSTLAFWEAWECIKKFVILLIITLLQTSPELSAVVLLLFMSFALVMTAVFEPFINALVNCLHLACDFLVFAVLLTGLLSTSAARTVVTTPEEVDTLSTIVSSYAAVVLAVLVAILSIEVVAQFPGGQRQRNLWNKFIQHSHDIKDNISRKLSTVGILPAMPELAMPELADSEEESPSSKVAVSEEESPSSKVEKIHDRWAQSADNDESNDAEAQHVASQSSSAMSAPGFTPITPIMPGKRHAAPR